MLNACTTNSVVTTCNCVKCIAAFVISINIVVVVIIIIIDSVKQYY